MTGSDDPVIRSVERVVRESYGRLVALLASRSGDIAAAEDALSDALAKALVSWPTSGVPKNPEAWLLTAASRKQIDAMRREQNWAAIVDDLHLESHRNQRQVTAMDSSVHLIPDTRLRLMFVCTHPSIDENIRAALMIQTVLGLDADRIASAFLVKPTTMGARLVRAKAKIRDAAIPFMIPGPDELLERIHAILEAIYAAFTIAIGIENVDSQNELTSESAWLISLVNELIPDHPEAMGLQAMIMFHQSRRSYPDEAGRYIPLSDRSTENWDSAAIEAANELLGRASELHSLGPYQLEAAIQSVHCQRWFTGQTDWEAIRHLYRGLIQISLTIAASIGLASATCHCGDTDEALMILDAIPKASVNRSASYWAVLAETQRRLQRTDEANEAYERAIGLTESDQIRSWLIDKIRQLHRG